MTANEGTLSYFNLSKNHAIIVGNCHTIQFLVMVALPFQTLHYNLTMYCMLHISIKSPLESSLLTFDFGSLSSFLGISATRFAESISITSHLCRGNSSCKPCATSFDTKGTFGHIIGKSYDDTTH